MPSNTSPATTRSGKRNALSATMECEISDGVKLYLDNLLRASTAELKSEIDGLKSLINQKDEQIADLSTKVVGVVQRNVELSSELKTLRDDMEERIDDLEQYGRKNSIRIEGISITDSETNLQLAEKVVNTLNEMGAAVTQEDFFRLHRPGKPHMKDGRRVAQTIVRFRSWAARARACGTRYSGTKEERSKRPSFVRPDLTKRRLSLLAAAQSALKDHDHAHAFVDGECNLIITNRSAKRKHRFNTQYDLHEALRAVDDYTVAAANGII